METKTLGQIKSEYYGEIGTLERDKLERELERELENLRDEISKQS